MIREHLPMVVTLKSRLPSISLIAPSSLRLASGSRAPLSAPTVTSGSAMMASDSTVEQYNINSAAEIDSQDANRFEFYGTALSNI